MSIDPVKFDKVWKDELSEIRKRRIAAGVWSEEQSDMVEDAELEGELFGLAMSGGGVRSGAFNLGLFQAIYRRGVAKGLDVLSTVSGGGYAGALISSEIALDRDGVDWGDNSDGSRKNRLSIDPPSPLSQPRKVYRVATHGRRMRDFVRLLSRHLSGWLLTTTFFLSIVVLIGSVLAWIMRLPWSTPTIYVLSELGFSKDWQLAVVPFCFAACVWLLTLFVGGVSRAAGWNVPPLSRVSYLFLLVMAIVTGVVLIGIDNIKFADSDGSLSAQVNNLADWAGTALTFVVGAVLLPYLVPHKLLASGQRNSSPYQKLIFNICGYGLLLGVPLSVFYVLGKENISGAHETRVERGELAAFDVDKLDEFVPQLQSSQDNWKSSIRSAILGGGYGEWKRLKDNKIATPGFLQRWLEYKDYLLRPEGSRFEKRFLNRQEKLEKKREIVESITDKCLSDPMLFELERGQEFLMLRDVLSVAATDSAAFSVPAHDLDTARKIQLQNSIRKLDVLQTEYKHLRIMLNFAGLELEKNLGPTGLEEFKDRRDPILSALKGRIYESATMLRQDLDLVKNVTAWRDQLINHVSSESSKADVGRWKILTAANRLISQVFNWSEPDSMNAPAATQLPHVITLPESDFFRNLIKHRPLRLTDEELKGSSSELSDIVKKEFASKYSKPFEERDQKLLNDDFVKALKDTLTANPLGEDAAHLLKTTNEEFTPKMTTGQKLCKLNNSLTKAALSSGVRDDPAYLAWLNRTQENLEKFIFRTRQANWAILNAIEPQYIKSQGQIYAIHVNGPDQAARLNFIFWSIVILLVVGLCSNMNVTSIHGVYRDQLAAAWLDRSGKPLSGLDTCRNGGPLHLVNCTHVHLSGASDPDPERRSRFVFSYLYSGSNSTKYVRTDFYDGNQTSMADAMAISGAAVTTGTANNMLYRIILLVTNFRLGQWVRNPSITTPPLGGPSPLRTLFSLLWSPGQRAYCFLSDGGHLDNTGLSALFERKCRLIILGDAGWDPDYHFEDLTRVLQKSRAKYGLEFEVLCKDDKDDEDIFEQLRPKKSNLSQTHLLCCRIKYPEDHPDGLLIVAKPSITGDEPLDITQWKYSHNKFPQDPTSNQFFEADEFEAYATLGRHIGDEIVDLLNGQRSFPDSDFPGTLPKPWLGGNPQESPPAVSFAADLPVNDQNIDAACEAIRKWADTTEEENTVGSPLLERIKLWVVDNIDLKNEDERFCRIGEATTESVFASTDRFLANEVSRQSGIDIIATTGRGVRGARKAMQILAARKKPTASARTQTSM